MALPQRGTGLRTGRARPRGWFNYPPLTEKQRAARHARTTALADDTGLWLGIASLLVGSLLIGAVILSK